MRKITRAASLGLALAGVIGFTAVVSAQDKEAIVKDRVATMKQQGGDLK